MYVIIGGGGKVGEALAQKMLKAGHEVVVIEKDEETADFLSRELRGRSMTILGDACDSSVMEDAGMRDADIFVVVMGHDEDNLAACEIANTLFKPPRIIARVNNPRNERIFYKLGIEAISSTTVIARMIEEEAMSSTMRTVMSLKHGEFSMMEIEIPRSASLKAEGGVRVSDLSLPASTILVAVSSGDNFDIVNGSTVLLPGDTVLVCSRSENEVEVRRILLDL